MPTTQPPGTLKCDHGRRRQAVVQSLLEDIFHGRLRAGQHLVTQDLAERFGVSHTPVREALITLSGMGLLDMPPNKGAIVRRISSTEVREVCQVRRVLECEAARRACGRIEHTTLEGLSARLKRLRDLADFEKSAFVDEARAVDNCLHDGIAAACGNAFLANELGRLKMLFRAFRDVAWEYHGLRNDYQRLAEEARQHLAIVEALQAGNAREASRTMARHISSAVSYWTRALPEDRSA